MKLTVKGDKWIVRRRGQDFELMYMIKIDPSQNPKVLDLTPDVGYREFVSLGIYKLEGGAMTLCRTTEGGDVDRPREFKTTPEEGILVVWKRTKN